MTDRNVLLISNWHTLRHAQALSEAVEKLSNLGLTPIVPKADREALAKWQVEIPTSVASEADQYELALVLGGDGSILRAAELTRESKTPILGVNMGHVGFLAEAEAEDLDAVITKLASGKYSVRDRITLEVTVRVSGKETYRSWALNEVTLEKNARERMLEVMVEVDFRPLSSFGCDGVLVATPTGSTAYAFSAGGPIIWPDVDALVLVPVSAHALFARPVVVDAGTSIAIELLERSAGNGVLWCDGRRSVDLAPGSRVEVSRSNQAVPLVVLEDSPFTDRLVKKFNLPVAGWRGAKERN